MFSKKILIMVVGFIIIIAIIGIFFSNDIGKKLDMTNNTQANTNTVFEHTEQSLPEPQEDEVPKRDLSKLSMEIKEGSVTNESVVVIIRDTNEIPYAHDEYFRIETLKNGTWQELKRNPDYVYMGLGILIGEDRELELKVTWTDLYGKLKKGTYRLIKRVIDGEISAEFTIP